MAEKLRKVCSFTNHAVSCVKPAAEPASEAFETSEGVSVGGSKLFMKNRSSMRSFIK